MCYTVAQELENGLVVVNGDFALIEGPPNEVDPRELDASEMAAKRRTVEQGRREAIRGSLERMTLFFRRPEPGYLWSRPQVLFYGELTVLISKPIGHSLRLSQRSRTSCSAQEHSAMEVNFSLRSPSCRWRISKTVYTICQNVDSWALYQTSDTFTYGV